MCADDSHTMVAKVTLSVGSSKPYARNSSEKRRPQQKGPRDWSRVRRPKLEEDGLAGANADLEAIQVLNLGV